MEETGVPGENHWPVASQWQTLSHNIISSTPRHESDSNSNFISDRHWLQIQLPYDHDHDGPSILDILSEETKGDNYYI